MEFLKYTRAFPGGKWIVKEPEDPEERECLQALDRVLEWVFLGLMAAGVILAPAMMTPVEREPPSGTDIYALLNVLEDIKAESRDPLRNENYTARDRERIQKLIKTLRLNPVSAEAEEKEIMTDLVSIRYASRSPVLEELMREMRRRRIRRERAASRIMRRWDGILESYAEFRPRVRGWLWAAPFLAGALGLILYAKDWPGCVRLAAQLELFLAFVWLVALAFGGVLIALTTQTNPWALLPPEFHAAPVIWLAVGALQLEFLGTERSIWGPVKWAVFLPCLSMGACLLVLKLGLWIAWS